MTTLFTVIAAALMLLGSFFVLVTGVVMFRARDALTRINALGPATALGTPMIVLGAWLYRVVTVGFSGTDLLEVVVTVGALVVVSSVATNTLARAAYLSGAPLDPATHPQDLAVDPRGD